MSLDIITTPTIDSTAKAIASGLANKAGSAAACIAAYKGSQAGLSLEELAKATSKILAADPASEKNSITKAAMEHRVNAAKFILANELPYNSGTIAIAYTLAQKATAAPEFKAVLAALGDQDKPVTRADVERELMIANKRAIEAKKATATPKETGSTEDSDKDNQSAAKDAKASADEVVLYLKAQVARKWNAKDTATLIAGFEQAIKSLKA